MNKDEILEKSRRDNDGMDERFKLMQWRASYLMLSVMMVVWALLCGIRFMVRARMCRSPLSCRA